MKKLWMRVGMTFSLTDAEAERILGSYDCSTMRDIVKSAFESGRARLDGNTYIPEECVEEFNDQYETDYEIGEYECDL